jgi:phosphoribosylaminoimidazolecarboxamide formyltransferase/IMP cyclohydrolase
MTGPTIQRAIISVSDKSGVLEFARALANWGVEIYSTGGTRRHLIDGGLAAKDIAEYTGFPEMMDGRLKTLHPRIFGGILCRRDRDDDMRATAEQGIIPFELVVVNLYPFESTVARAGVTRADAVEQIDIGGPSLIRAAAKNHAFVTVATSAEHYGSILDELSANRGATSEALRRRLMAAAFAHTAAYDALIAAHFSALEDANCSSGEAGFPKELSIPLRRVGDELRYGENPHQRAALYQVVGERGGNLVSAQQRHGKELSYNNLLDLDSALAIVRQFTRPACAVIKHNNPCGAATADSLQAATERAMQGDPQSAFGSVLGINQTVDRATAEYLSTPGLFVEAIVAPDYDPEAIEILRSRPKWKNSVRLMSTGSLEIASRRDFLRIDGGLLVQDADSLPDPTSEWRVATRKAPDDALTADLQFAWNIVRYVKSNAIVVCRHGTLLGAGAGQMSRVDSVGIAIAKAGRQAQGAVMASDAFFPFPDSIEQAAAAGISAVIQPGGSKNDDQVVAACDKHGIAMIMTGRRHFKH